MELSTPTAYLADHVKPPFRWRDSLRSLLPPAPIQQNGHKSRKLYAVPNKETKPINCLDHTYHYIPPTEGQYRKLKANKKTKRKIQEEKCELEKTLLDLEINANDSTIDSLISIAKALPKAIHKGLLKRTRFEKKITMMKKQFIILANIPGKYVTSQLVSTTRVAAYRYVRYLVISISCKSLNPSPIILT